MTEWFRRVSWTSEDEREFFARLGRSRGSRSSGDFEASLNSLGDTLAAEQRFPRFTTGARLDLAWLIAKRQIRPRYDEALALLEEHGDRAAAKRFATVAVESAERCTSGLRYHKSVGLVGDRYGDVFEEMRRWSVA